MANPVEWVNLVLRVRILKGFAGIRFAAANEIRCRVHGAGKPRA